jgi:predicted metal-dependent hydrolase
MKDFTSFFLLLIVSTIFYLYLENKANEVTYVVSNVDTKKYLVRNVIDKQDAADMLGTINTNLLLIVEYLYKNKNDEKFKNRLDDINRLKDNFNSGSISESSPNNKYTSYSINKGEKIVFCIRSKTIDTKLVDLNTVMFVAIHELGHLMTKSIGHKPTFWDNMKFLLEVGIELGVYTKQDFAKNPVEYCGTNITDTPLD